jgi:hypothetical protein
MPCRLRQDPTPSGARPPCGRMLWLGREDYSGCALALRAAAPCATFSGAARLRRTSTVRPLPPRHLRARPPCGRKFMAGAGGLLGLRPRPPGRRALRDVLRRCAPASNLYGSPPPAKTPSCQAALRPQIYGWGGRIRTSDAGVKVRCLNRLATPQYAKFGAATHPPNPAAANGSFPAPRIRRPRAAAAAAGPAPRRGWRKAQTHRSRCRSSALRLFR